MTSLADRESLVRAVGGNLGDIRPLYGYYRQPNGWIQPAITTELEELHYRREGWVPLPQYGRFDMGSSYAASHPLELLFIHGGAKELCEDQIRQEGLYFNLPMIPGCRQALTQYHKGHSPSCWAGAQPVVFPQLASMTNLGPFPCRFCNRQSATAPGRDQHESVMHKDEKGNIRTGEVLAASLTKGLTAQSTGESKSLEALTTLTQEITKLKRTRTRKRVKATASV